MVHSSDEGGEIYIACNVEKYSNDSQFDTNLETLLKTLTEKATYAGFDASVYGQEMPNKACSAEAVKVIQPDCPNAIGARVQLDHCFLRYENYTFLSDLETNFWYGLVNVNNNNDIHFNAAIRDLLADLSSRAPTSPIKFALGSLVVSSNVTIYGMEMCWRDMSKDDCASCLSKGYEEVFSISSQRVGAQVFMGSCTLGYEIYPFAEHY
ncbi:hypothetical protein SUGI_0781810 [Cryptomeria japonica]|nr:hypothetical protein SUGI_0781810 [Cryptomeria japonica]